MGAVGWMMRQRDVSQEKHKEAAETDWTVPVYPMYRRL